jgi:transposase
MEGKGGSTTRRPIRNDLRLRIHEARAAGEGTAEVAERFAVATAFVRRRLQRFRLTGSLAPTQHAGGPARKLAAPAEALRQAVRDCPDATPQEHTDRLNLPAARVTVWRALRRLRISRTKQSTHAAEQGRPDVAAARRQWPQKLVGSKPEDLVFLDATGANTARQRTHGYAPLGERVVAPAPLAGWQAVTFVGTLTAGGWVAPWALEGAMNGEWFLAYVEPVLVPALRPGMVVVLDNLPSHKVQGVEPAIAAAGCRLLYLPAYSPDLNPIANAYSKLKRSLRDWAARTVEGVYEGLRRVVRVFIRSVWIYFFCI